MTHPDLHVKGGTGPQRRGEGVARENILGKCTLLIRCLQSMNTEGRESIDLLNKRGGAIRENCKINAKKWKKFSNIAKHCGLLESELEGFADHF